MPNTYGRQVVEALTNKSGGAVAAGDVVIIDTSNDGAFTTTTTARSEVTIGIVQEAIASNATGRVLLSGYAALVNVPASVTRGHFVETHTVAKQATGSSTRRSGSFGQFRTGGTTPTAPLWGNSDQTASSPGALARTTVGYATIGGSNVAMAQYDHYVKQVTLATDGFLASVSIYIKGTGSGSALGVRVGVWDDVTGAPGHIRATGAVTNGASGIFPETVNGVASDAGWLTIPIGVWLAAGTYWIGFMQTNAGGFNIYYDGSGSDRKWTAGADNISGATTRYTITTTTNKYSIYADILR
jgi:hypothetical protein